MSAVTDAIVPAALVLAPVLMEVASTSRSPAPDMPSTSAPATRALSTADADAAEELTVDDDAFMVPAPAGRLRVASFNMLNVGERQDKDFERLARIVQQFDLCNVLELQNEQALRDLTAALGSGWAHVISDREAGDPDRSKTFEFYGFVYRTSKVTPLDGPTGFFPDPGAIFSREPFFASFRSGQFDFTVITLHAESPDHSASLRQELEHLPDVLRHVQDLDPQEDDLLLMGDFNRSPSTNAGNPAQAWQALLGMPQMDCVIPDTQPTTLSSKAQGLANHYDDICLTHDNTAEFTGTQGAFDFVAAMFEGQNVPAKHFVSDHLPVWAEFRTDLPDDDGTAPGGGGAGTHSTVNCCRICRTSKACGDGCIARDLNCTQDPGCACDG
jgi:endonuclease/exonuclease/phosphatase family metal-dependent hydrolase